jgi:transmembrane sensor
LTDDELNELLVRAVSEERLDAADAARLRSWMSASPSNARRLDEMRQTWALLGRRQLPVPAFDAAGLRTRRDVRRVAERTARTRRRWTVPAWAAAAAAALLALSRLDAVAVSERHATAGAAANVRLADGSAVRLAPYSRLEVLRGADGRDVRLVSGRAFFAVVKRDGRSFRVRSPAGDVRVLGTRFDVRGHPSRTDLIVVDGRVELSTADARVIVRAGEASHAERGAVAATQRVDSVFTRLAWMGGEAVFNSTPLPQVADEIRQRFHVAVDVDPALAAHTVTGTINARELRDVVSVVCRVVSATCDVDARNSRVTIGAQRPRP